MHRRRSENYASWRGEDILTPPPPLSRLLEDVQRPGKGIDVVYLMVLIVLHFNPL